MLMTTEDVAKLTGFSAGLFNKMRTEGGGPCFLKIGASVRYLEEDVMEWLKSRRRSSTSAKAPPPSEKEGK